MRPSVDTGLTLKKGTWTAEEDRILKDYVDKNGEGKWNLIPLKTGLNRCRKSCRLRWLNYLSPNIKRGHFEEDEIDLIRRLHKLLGNKWSLIAGRIPGRTSNDVKNYWNTYIRSRSSNETNEPKEDTSAMVTVIKPQPHTFSKPLDCNPPPAVPHDNDFDTSSGLISSPMVSDDMIKEYLDELHYDNEIGWSLNDHAMNGRVLDVEQRVSESSFFDLPIEDGMIKEYLDELPYDNEIGWSLDDHAMKSRVLDVEQKVSESGYFDLPIEESTWDFSDLINI